MPKDDAKIIDVDKIFAIKGELVDYIQDKDELYYDFSNVILQDNGYLASLLGYDIVNVGEHKIILNRSAIKVVK